MKLETKYDLGQRIGYRGRGEALGYLFMVGVVASMAIVVDMEGKPSVRYRMLFDDPKRRSGWKNWFAEEELEPL